MQSLVKRFPARTTQIENASAITGSSGNAFFNSEGLGEMINTWANDAVVYVLPDHVQGSFELKVSSVGFREPWKIAEDVREDDRVRFIVRALYDFSEQLAGELYSHDGRLIGEFGPPGRQLCLTIDREYTIITYRASTEADARYVSESWEGLPSLSELRQHFRNYLDARLEKEPWSKAEELVYKLVNVSDDAFVTDGVLAILRETLPPFASDLPPSSMRDRTRNYRWTISGHTTPGHDVRPKE